MRGLSCLLVLDRMLEDNFKEFMKTSKYAKMAKSSNDTALQDIQSLNRRGIFPLNPVAAVAPIIVYAAQPSKFLLLNSK